MTNWAALHSILEVSIWIAGFSGVVIAFGRRAWSSRAILLLPPLFDVCLLTIVLAFFPMVLLTTNLGEPISWQITSAVTAIYIALVVPYRRFRMRKCLVAPPSNPGRHMGFTLHACVFSLSLSNALWLRVDWPHLAALVIMLVLSFAVFGAIVTETFVNTQEK